MSFTRSTFILAALCSPLVSSSAAQSRLIGVETTGAVVYELDPATGTRTLIGPLVGTSTVISAMAYDPVGDVLYATASAQDALYTIDLNALTTTLVGPFNVGTSVNMHGLEFVPATGKLYARSASLSNGFDFFELDPLTGQGTPISATGFAGFGSLSYINGVMYMADTISDSLTTIDLVTGVPTVVGPFGIASQIGAGLAYSPSTGLLAIDNIGDALYSVDVTTGAATLIAPVVVGNMISLEFIPGGSSGIGTPYCGAVANTTGNPGLLNASGSATVVDNDVLLAASDLPPNQFGFFLTSMTQDLIMNPGGSNGNLCLGGTIGRYVGAGQIQNSGAAGAFDLVLDLTQTPAGPVFVSIAAGETWNFQCWFRDIGPMGQPESNFTDGRSITFN